MIRRPHQHWHGWRRGVESRSIIWGKKCCITSPPEEGAGGRTVFPEDGLAVAPKRGTALIYRSKTELLHFSEPVTKPGVEKAILQLLIDHRLPPGHEHMPLVDWDTGAIIPG